MKSKTKKPLYTGKTKAYRRFNQHYWRTKRLLNAGISGIEEERKPIEGILEKLSKFKMPRGKFPNNYTPHVKSEKNVEGKGLTLSLDIRSAAFLKKVVEKEIGDHKQLRYHYFSILSVSMWGSYETYVSMLFEELFKKQPLMLKTNESITYYDIIENKENITQYLIDKSLDKIGHFTIKELLPYLDDKLNFKYSSQRVKTLEDIYLIRNIIAHSSGMLRKGQEKMLPAEISVKDGELRITKAYLEKTHTVIKSSVTLLEKHVEKKFFKKK